MALDHDALITQLETNITALNTLIAARLAGGELDVAYSLPTGHSVDTKGTLDAWMRLRTQLRAELRSLKPAYQVTRGL